MKRRHVTPRMMKEMAITESRVVPPPGVPGATCREAGGRRRARVIAEPLLIEVDHRDDLSEGEAW